MPKATHLTFANNHREFSSTLNKRVNDYFKTNKLSRQANSEMKIKTIFMFSLYVVPYVLIISGVVTGILWSMVAFAVMGLGVAGIGLSIMHDANHQSYSNRSWINTLLGYSLNLLGANAFNWRMQHNILHHTFTNVHQEDEDISPRGALRLTPHSNWKKMHKYQFIYAWFLYGLMTIIWLVFKDFERIIKYNRDGLIKKHKGNVTREWIILIATKLIFITYMFVIPVVFTPLLGWQVLTGVLLMHYIAGFIMAIIFQPAHVIEGTEFPLPDENNKLEHTWAVHQLHTTTNWGNRSRWLSWCVGGLNFQIEHHLFPNICHVHYRKIAGIVQSTATEYGLPYKSTRTFGGALLSHLKLLRQLGIKPAVARATTAVFA